MPPSGQPVDEEHAGDSRIARYDQDRRGHRDELADQVAAHAVRDGLGAQQGAVLAVGGELLDSSGACPGRRTCRGRRAGPGCRVPSRCHRRGGRAGRRSPPASATGQSRWPTRSPPVKDWRSSIRPRREPARRRRSRSWVLIGVASAPGQFGLAHQGQVGVLQGGPADFESAIASPCWRNRSRTNAVDSVRGSGEPLPVAGPAHLVLARDPLGEFVGGAVGDDPAAAEDEDAVGELLGLVEVVGGQQDRGLVVVRPGRGPGRGTRAGPAGRSRPWARRGTAARAGRRCRSPRPAGGAARRRAS